MKSSYCPTEGYKRRFPDGYNREQGLISHDASRLSFVRSLTSLSCRCRYRCRNPILYSTKRSPRFLLDRDHLDRSYLRLEYRLWDRSDGEREKTGSFFSPTHHLPFSFFQLHKLIDMFISDIFVYQVWTQPLIESPLSKEEEESLPIRVLEG